MELTLGDRASGQLLRELKQIVGDIVGTELLKSLWLQRLLESLSGACGFGVSGPLAATADKTYKVYARTVVGEGSPGDDSATENGWSINNHRF